MTDRSLIDSRTPGMRFAPWLAKTNPFTSRNIAAASIPGLINLSGGMPDPSLLPAKELSAIAAQAILDYPDDCLGYGPTPGLADLREMVAQRFRARGVPAKAENVLMTASGTQALDLLGKIFTTSGDTIACEIPSYAGAFDAWRPRNPTYRHLGLREGRDLAARMAGAAFTYMIPNFSNPTGYLVTLEERQKLLDAARMSGTPLVEDDPYGALFYDGEPLPTLLELASTGKENLDDCPIIHLGSLSKQLAPGMRVGWIIAAPQTIRMLSTAKQASDMCSNGLAQRMAVSAMQTGLIEACHPRIIALYRARRNALYAAMARHIADYVRWEVPAGGMFVWANLLDTTVDVERLVDLGMQAGVLIGPGEPFDPLGIVPPAIRLSFTYCDEARLELGMARLAQTFQAMGVQPGARTYPATSPSLT